MVVAKLTDYNGCTHDDTQWGPGIRHEVKKWTGELCTGGVIHAYVGATERDAVALGLIMNPIHANYSPARLWICEAKEPSVTDNTKSGFAAVTTIREILVPPIPMERKAEAAICYAAGVYKEPSFLHWAQAWIDGSYRSGAAAWAAAWAARAEPNLDLAAFLGPILLPDYQEEEQA